MEIDQALHIYTRNRNAYLAQTSVQLCPATTMSLTAISSSAICNTPTY